MNEREHKNQPLLKAFLSSVPVPEDFELQLWIRRALRELPSVHIPDTFEEALWQRIHAEQQINSWRHGLAISVLLTALWGGILGLWPASRSSTSVTQTAPLRGVVVTEPLLIPADQRFIEIPPQPPRKPSLQPQRSLMPIPGGTNPLPPPEE